MKNELRDFLNDIKILGGNDSKVNLLVNGNPLTKSLANKEYDYLRTEPRLGKNIALLGVGGSHSYGTNIDTDEHTSDFDLRGVFNHSKEELLTMQYIEKPLVNIELDVSIAPMKHFIDLLKKCNPNTIELLGVRDSDIFVMNETGKLLKDNVELFLTQKAYSSFGGYAQQQLRRLQNALIKDGTPDMKEEHILKAVFHSSMVIKEKYKHLMDNGVVDFYIDENLYCNEEYNKEIFININIDRVPFREFRSYFSELENVVISFDKLNHRNKKKDELHLYKHAMHLIRLNLEGIEILNGEGINTYREKDRLFLLDIRNKKYTFAELFKLCDDLERMLKEAFNNSKLAKKPDDKKIAKLFYEINEYSFK